jgi:predicted transcriptional regulator
MPTTFGVKLDEATQQRLKAVAKCLERAPHWVMKTALAEYLDREEAALREREEDDARWKRFQETGQAIEQERVMRWLDALAAGCGKPCPK